MAAAKSSFLEKVLGRINRLDTRGLQTVVQRLARERSFLETLFNTIEDGVIVLDESGKVIYINQSATNLLGLQDKDVEGQKLTRHLPEFDWERLRTIDAEGGSKIVRQEFEVHYPKQRFLRVYAAPLDGEKSGASGVALILHDATETRQKTHEAIESERLQALTLLAASVAHEIGNPLNALHIHLQLMEREVRKMKAADQTPPQSPRRSRSRINLPDAETELGGSLDRLEKYVLVAKGEISRLDYIVTQFLQAIRPNPPRLQPWAVNEVILDTLELLRPELDNRSIETVEDLGEKVPITLLDPAQIKQVLVNLIKNAMQAMAGGGSITLRSGGGSDGVWFSVTDTGSGIPAEQMRRIFEPFYTTKDKGSGLGLMIVQRIIREHGGRIDLESRPEVGTTFRIWLPPAEKNRRLLNG